MDVALIIDAPDQPPWLRDFIEALESADVRFVVHAQEAVTAAQDAARAFGDALEKMRPALDEASRAIRERIDNPIQSMVTGIIRGYAGDVIKRAAAQIQQRAAEPWRRQGKRRGRH